MLSGSLTMRPTYPIGISVLLEVSQSSWGILTNRENAARIVSFFASKDYVP
jgi:hypothetical protein